MKKNCLPNGQSWKAHLVLTFILVALVAILIIGGLKNLGTPIEAGVWRYSAIAISFLKTHTLAVGPYFGQIGKISPFMPTLYAYLLSLVHFFDGNMITFSEYLPLVIKLCLPVLFFLWLSKYDRTAGFFSTFLILTSPVLLLPLGHMYHFFLPLTGFLFLATMKETQRPKRIYICILAGIATGILATLYILAFGFLFLYFLSYLIFEPSKRNIKYAFVIVLIAILLWGVVNFQMLGNSNPVHTRIGSIPAEENNYFDTFWHREIPLIPAVFPTTYGMFHAPLIWLLFILGGGHLLRKNEYRHLVLWTVLTVAFYLTFSTGNMTIDPLRAESNVFSRLTGIVLTPSMISAFTRFNHYVAFCVAIISGFGAYCLFAKLEKYRKYCGSFFALLLCGILLYCAHARISPKTEGVMYSDEYDDALVWLKSQPGTYVTSNLHTIGIIYTLSEKLSITEGPIGSTEYLSWDDVMRKMSRTRELFATHNPEVAMQIFKEYDLSHVIYFKQLINKRILAETFNTQEHFEKVFENDKLIIFKTERHNKLTGHVTESVTTKRTDCQPPQQRQRLENHPSETILGIKIDTRWTIKRRNVSPM